MWDCGFMADIENLNEINENFDTIKTLLNSIRAQGILNTSDVDKLLSGINTKLEKINTEEDIDLIKVFLTELKQNLDERHNILVSKFAAIESLFSNLLKNSNEMTKSSELKELFDIVATNLSVFSREVVAQKESLTDITMRLDAIRSDDSQKKDIIKNITLLKPDLERLNNGFDTIVLSLNDNFKTLAKTISTIDKTEYLDRFAGSLNSIEMSSNTILSAIQVLDKKTVDVDNYIKELAKKADIDQTDRNITELKLLNQTVNQSVNDISERFYKIDNLTDKIDASVSIIAGLKSLLEETEDSKVKSILENIDKLSEKLNDVKNDNEFEEFKSLLTSGLREISESAVLTDKNLNITSENVSSIIEMLKALDVNTNFSLVLSAFDKNEANLKNHIDAKVHNFAEQSASNLNKIIDNILTNADSLNTRINQAQLEVSSMCNDRFGSVFEYVNELKNSIAQLDENSTASGNAMFANISDRLSLFETTLKSSLEKQEAASYEASAKLIEQFEGIKNISSTTDYKIDSSVVEISNMTRGFEVLKASIDDVLALNFIENIKELRSDIYASKQDLAVIFDSEKNGLSENIKNDIFDKYELITKRLNTIDEEFKNAQTTVLAYIQDVTDKISSSLVDIISYVSESKEFPIEEIEKRFEGLTYVVKETNLNCIENIRDAVDKLNIKVEEDIKSLEINTVNYLNSVNSKIDTNTEDIRNDIKNSYDKLAEISQLYNEIKGLINVNALDSSNEFDKLFKNVDGISSEFETKLTFLKTTLIDKITEVQNKFAVENSERAKGITSAVSDMIGNVVSDNDSARAETFQKIHDDYEDLKSKIEKLAVDNSDARSGALEKLMENFVSLKEYMQKLNSQNEELVAQKTEDVIDYLESVKAVLNKVDENVDGDMTRQLSIIESNFESLVSQMSILSEKTEQSLVEKINDEYQNVSEKLDNSMTQKLEEYKARIEEVFDGLSEKAQSQSSYLQERISDINSAMKSVMTEQSSSNMKQINEAVDKLKEVFDTNIEASTADYESLKTKLDEFANDLKANNETLADRLKAQLEDMTKYVDSVIDIQTQESDAHIDEFVKLIESSSEKNKLIFDDFTALIKNTSLEEVNSMEESAAKLLEQLDIEKQMLTSMKEFLSEALQKKLNSISSEIEKETDAIIAELADQFDAVKKTQQDTAVQITSGIESLIEGQLFNNIEDLKAYLDVKTNTSDLSAKLDNLKLDMTSSFESAISDLNKMLNADVFTSALSDYRIANEILINSAADRINEKVAGFIAETSTQLSGSISQETKNIESKLALFDKKFIDTVIDKYEEIKMSSNQCNSYFNELQQSINDIFADFQGTKSDIDSKIAKLVDVIKISTESANFEIKQLCNSFENLRSQISNKSFDEAFQSSINKQIGSLESLIQEQLSYIEDINDICGVTLPDISELSTLIKGSLIESMNSLLNKTEAISNQLASQNTEEQIEEALKDTKTDIITQFLNIFNQISFVAEQEEIIDYIQERHDELITVLSHIVTNTSVINDVKDNVELIDDKINSIKDEISLINDKITNIISSDGDIDYIYSLQDLESDIANLRIVLKEMKDNTADYGNEFADLMSSTERVYKLVESIKEELPDKKSLEGIAEDIESISTRTNKLILASDESYKELHDNLREFKLVIDDLDERTRNFAQESGMDKIDLKLNTLNTMVQKGAKTNQVFNQVFEYLAEWIDNAGNQISAISDKVETLDDIGQIKSMLTDLKADAEDNSENVELIEALSNVFDKQAKKITSLETKLDKMIVQNTISAQKNKPDMKPLEDTMNSFLAAIGERMTSQQEKINSLESQLEKVVDMLEEKDTAQLTKKVGGMDKQIAKLNKSIEKIASHVVDK